MGIFGINWSRQIRRATTKAVKGGTRWASKPYREQKRNNKAAARRRKTWRAR
ncbi:hypothetical protein PBI_DEWDROP_102 [Microbacterium phage Dewdrop]|nr:hypothetical protein PBI_LEAF_102 [Microbacterium phage Leaf]QGZ17470.1 hypothetical protein PBI_DEWDROP_102 [Microbacterium phage Dewdrop]